MISKWAEMTSFWHAMGGINMAGAPDASKCLQGKDMCHALAMEVAELTDSFDWKTWRESDKIDIDNIEREIVDCLFFLHHIAENFRIKPDDLDKRFELVMANNKRRYIDGDFSGETEAPELTPTKIEESLSGIHAALDTLILMNENK